METEDVEVSPNLNDERGLAGRRHGSSVSSTSPSPPPSPSKVSPPSPSHKKPSRPPGGEGTVNGEGKEGPTDAADHPPHKSPLSGIGAPRMPNIKIKKQYSKIYRIKTKILQNLGKADKTTDEVFDDYEVNFNKQQLNANRLHKEIANYLRCARALHGASKALFETLSEIYEPEWVGHDLLYVQAQNSDMLWTDFCHKIQDQTLVPLTAYTQEFPEIRKKIDKRGRKLVDFDSQRHHLENLQRSARRDEYKIARVKDQLENARSTYESLNKELYEELPTIFDQRIPNTANTLQTLFAAEATFMQETSKISQELEAIAEKLGKECSKGTYKSKRGSPPKAPRPLSVSAASSPSPTSPHSPAVWYEAADSKQQPQETETAPQEGVAKEEEKKEEEKQVEQEREGDHKDEEEVEEFVPEKSSPPTLPLTPPPASPSLESSKTPPAQMPRKSKDENRPTISNPASGKEEGGRPYEEIEFEDKKVNGTPQVNGEVIGTQIPTGNKTRLEDIYDIPVGATTEGLPPGVLYRVRATYKYVREDVDELGFEVGETIQVVEYDDPEEQEEGWLCGIKESTNEKGLFPANFTRPI